MEHQKLFVVVLLVTFFNGLGTNAVSIPAECKDKIYCESDKVPDYYKPFQSVISDKFKDIHTTLDLKSKTYFDDQNDENDLYFPHDFNCMTETKVITPYAVRTNDTVMAVVQTNYYKQMIKTTECLSVGEKCFKPVSDPTNEARCRPKYSTIILYVFNERTREIERLPSPFPACCVCSFQRYPSN